VRVPFSRHRRKCTLTPALSRSTGRGSNGIGASQLVPLLCQLRQPLDHPGVKRVLRRLCQLGSGRLVAAVVGRVGPAGGEELREWLVSEWREFKHAFPTLPRICMQAQFLLEHRDGLLRIFGVANQFGLTLPPIRVRLYQNGALLSTTTVDAANGVMPIHAEEGDLGASWNLVIPAAQLRRGLAVVADIDPDNAVAEGNEADNTFPRSGTPMPLDIRPVPPLKVRFVPVYQSASDRLGAVNDANRDQFLATTRLIHPIVDASSDLRATYTTSARALDRSDDDAWAQILSEVNALRLADGNAAGRHYYGVVSTAYTSGIAGLGYVAGRSAIGWDFLPSASNVVAHELGHNWGRYHAPCGDVTRPDTRYPYAGGVTGVYGYDFGTNTVRPPSSADLMSYCASQWISDYTYRGVLDYRETDPTVQTASATNGILVWGRIVNGTLLLEPAFEVVAPPSLPARSGPYAVDGLASDGSAVFSLSFTPDEVADAPGQQQFAFVVPLSRARASRLATFRLVSRNRAATVSAAAPTGIRFRVGAAPGEATLRRAANGRVALRWDATTHPMVMVRDPSTRQILSFARGGSAQIVVGPSTELDLVASDRIHSQGIRARIAP